MMSNKQTIESNLFKGLDNCINAEISCGTIGTLTDGIHWLKKSYYYQRVTKNPTAYAIPVNKLREDPGAHFILLETVTETVRRLNRMQLIRYNEQTETVYPTDMGRIASNYYINVKTMSYFMENLKAHTSEEYLLYHLAHADEFEQLEARKEEYDELKLLMNDIRYVMVDKTCFNEAYTKVLVLFEMYLRGVNLKTFSLISDMAYIV
jgi:replicative superfamily II helicase